MIAHVRLLSICLLITLAFALGSCGGRSANVPPQVQPAESIAATPVGGGAGWPSGLPNDARQPWETRDAATINQDSELLLGAQRWFDSGDVLESGDALRLASGTPGNVSVSYAIYRIAWAGGDQPGAVSVDVNLHRRGDGKLSSFYLGVADYSRSTWAWHGPFTDNHVRLSTPGPGYLSGANSSFIAVVACDGAEFEIVAVGANPRDPADATAPPAPVAIGATPLISGLQLDWTQVGDADLAGYRVYWNDIPFTDPAEPGVQSLDYLVGETTLILPRTQPQTTHVRVAAVDLSGNRSPFSPAASATPLAGSPPEIELRTDVTGGTFNLVANLYVSGAEAYDWDLDGDGQIDVPGDTTGQQQAVFSRPGIIRPHVYGFTGTAECRACGAVSLVISSNTRPVAHAWAIPQSGPAPLTLDLLGEGIDFDDGDSIIDYSWDINGDGMFDTSNQFDPVIPNQLYNNPGIYNAKLRVTDQQGAWDFDTVAIQVTNPENLPPVAVLEATPTSGNIGITVTFDGSGSYDPGPNPGIRFYYWDFGNGYTERITSLPTTSYTYNLTGTYTAKCTVVDVDGDTGEDSVLITVSNTAPTAGLVANHLKGPAPLHVQFDATGCSDPEGNISRYEWDFDDDGIYEASGTSPQASHVYQQAGGYTCSLRVVDAEGLSDTATVDLVATGWYTTTVVSNNYIWITCAGAEVDGHPALVYLDATPAPEQIMYVRALDEYGMEWGTPVSVADSDSWAAHHVNLAVVSGNPAVCFMSDFPLLCYRRANDALGTSWGSIVAVDTNSNRGEAADMAIVDGRPAVIYADRSTDDLVYTRANDATGASWPATGNALAVTGTMGYAMSLAVIAYRPAITYYDNIGLNIYYMRAQDSVGGSWDAPQLVVSGDGYGIVDLFSFDHGIEKVPAIGYLNGTAGGFWITMATDTTGSAWSSSFCLDDSPLAGWPISLGTVNGLNNNNCAVYSNGGDGSLWFVENIDDGHASHPFLIDDIGHAGGSCQAFNVGNDLGVAYLELYSKDLRYAQLIQ